MLALERLSLASRNFDQTIDAHCISYKAINLVLQQTFDSNEPYSKYPQLEKIYKQAGYFDDFEIFVEQCESIEKNDYFYLRKNFFLGICSAFDEFIFSCIAALSYEPMWRSISVGKRMLYEVSDMEFYEKFLEVEIEAAKEKSKHKPRSGILQCKFNDLKSEDMMAVDGVFWLRNQLTHNLNIAKEDFPSQIFSKKYTLGTEIVLDTKLVNDSVSVLNRVVKSIYEETPSSELLEI